MCFVWYTVERNGGDGRHNPLLPGIRDRCRQDFRGLHHDLRQQSESGAAPYVVCRAGFAWTSSKPRSPLLTWEILKQEQKACSAHISGLAGVAAIPW